MRRAFLRRVIFPFWVMDARKKFRWIAPHLRVDDQVIELGSGMGSLLDELRGEGFDVAACDIDDHSVREDLAPDIYDGRRADYPDGAFDVCILSTVLHHVSDPDALLREALRIAPKVIVIEDIYASEWQRRLTFAMDSLLNWEFLGHPHANRRDCEWRAAFDALGARLLHSQSTPIALFFRQAVYVIEQEAA
ncbi:MAG: class I SAM-dependent methyltransferase [Pseudomonadota bacterium]